MVFPTGSGLGIVEAGAVARLRPLVSINDKMPARVPKKKSGGFPRIILVGPQYHKFSM